jgi:hypothetical protein
MPEDSRIRWGWLKAMYLYTLLGAGGFGVALLTFPDLTKQLLSWPAGEPIALGIVGSAYAAFGVLAVFGLLSPLKFAPVLLLQLVYKSIWLVGVFLPLLLTSQPPDYVIPLVIIFSSYVIGDLIALPFAYLFGKQ